MKIVFLNHFISGGGAERVTCLLAGKMAENGLDVTMMTDLFRPFAYHVNDNVKRLPLFITKKQAGSHVYFLYMVRNVRRMIKKIRPDVIIGVLPVMNMVAVIAARGTKTKVIASHHTSFDRPVGIHIRFIQTFGYRLADAVTVLTQADYNYLGKKLPQKVVMPNPLAYPCVEGADYSRKKNILAVGRLDVWDVKGFDLLIQAWAKISQDFPEWTLEIAGGGKEESQKELQRLVEDAHVGNQVRFLGFRNDIDAVMRESSIFVLSSRIEGFGMVLVEAMSQGCACISFDDGGRQREIIRSDKEGIIISNHSDNDLAEAIRKLITNQKERMDMASQAISRASDFSLDKIEQKWESLIDIVCKS